MWVTKEYYSNKWYSYYYYDDVKSAKKMMSLILHSGNPAICLKKRR